MYIKIFLLVFCSLGLTNFQTISPSKTAIISEPIKIREELSIDSVLAVLNREFDKDDEAFYTTLVESLNQLDEDNILIYLRKNKILAGEHVYDANTLWKLHKAALTLGTHSNIALTLRRTNKFQASLETKERVKNEIFAYMEASNYKLPEWINFDDLTVIEDKRLGSSNLHIQNYFKSIKTKFTDDVPWCAAYVGAKLKAFDRNFTLPDFPYRAASYGGFSHSFFNFNKIYKGGKNKTGRYAAIKGITYLPDGETERYTYTMDDFKDKNRIPFGSMVVFQRTGGGHIGFIVGTIKDRMTIFDENNNMKTIEKEGIVILGGNQNDAVQFEIFYDFDKIRAVSIPSEYSKEHYFPIPEIENKYDLPELYDRKAAALR